MDTSTTTEKDLTTGSNLSITVLHVDESIIVIHKPCNLRSVPGHANPPPSDQKCTYKHKHNKQVAPLLSKVEIDASSNKRCKLDQEQKKLGNNSSSSFTPKNGSSDSSSSSCAIENNESSSSSSGKSHRVTAQETWIEAISKLSTANNNPDTSNEQTNQANSNDEGSTIDSNALQLIHNLANQPKNASIPRKCAPFVRFCLRNQRRLFSITNDHKDNNKTTTPHKQQQQQHQAQMEAAAKKAHQMIQNTQKPLLSLPASTPDEQSALGQLKRLGLSDENEPIRVVHRLDCETSGVMIFARNIKSASKLCHAWRHRDSVTKVYLANVLNWPPYHQHCMKSGVIDLPLAASSTHRIKWEVTSVDLGGRPSTTEWNILGEHNSRGNETSTQSSPPSSPVTLALRPITGRTHQLRIHCAEIGSGIIGDSLYGDNPIEWMSHDHEGQAMKTLQLHAHRLKFPHPDTNEVMEFVSPKPW